MNPLSAEMESLDSIPSLTHWTYQFFKKNTGLKISGRPVAQGDLICNWATKNFKIVVQSATKKIGRRLNYIRH
jgi:hypothetical protein